MDGTVIIVGMGSGVSAAVAQRFGRQGCWLALVARDAGRLSTQVDALRTAGIRAADVMVYNAAAPVSSRCRS
jgi:NADP-dependent 3-hydroxy acid dehydrogenase YdfG